MKICKIFTFTDQDMFSRLSGDYNPIHLDSEYCKSSIYGEILVHGAHAFLFGMEHYLQYWEHRVDEVSVEFKKPIFLNRDISYLFKSKNIELVQGNCLRCRIKLKTDGQSSQHQKIDVENYIRRTERLDSEEVNLTPTRVLPSKALIGQSLSCRPVIDFSMANKFFPNICRYMPELLDLLAITRLVGMELPGENSIFANFEIKRRNLPGLRDVFFQVKDFDSRFNMLVLAVKSYSWSGRIRAFFREPSLKRVDSIKLDPKLNIEVPTGRRCLILGGSRGLGRGLALGCAQLGLDTVATCRSDNLLGSLVPESLMSKLTYIVFDVNTDSFDLLKNHEFDYIFYCCSPKILPDDIKNSDELREEYSRVFVDCFIRAYSQLKIACSSFFYPSTSFLAEKESRYGEYCNAKRRAENFCVDKSDIVCIRLPAFLTDQTNANTSKGDLKSISSIVNLCLSKIFGK